MSKKKFVEKLKGDLKVIRVEAGMGQGDLAKGIKLSQASVSNNENVESPVEPSLSTIYDWAKMTENKVEITFTKK